MHARRQFANLNIVSRREHGAFAAPCAVMPVENSAAALNTLAAALFQHGSPRSTRRPRHRSPEQPPSRREYQANTQLVFPSLDDDRRARRATEATRRFSDDSAISAVDLNPTLPGSGL
jgi:hypothetical protein